MIQICTFWLERWWRDFDSFSHCIVKLGGMAEQPGHFSLIVKLCQLDENPVTEWLLAFPSLPSYERWRLMSSELDLWFAKTCDWGIFFFKWQYHQDIEGKAIEKQVTERLLAQLGKVTTDDRRTGEFAADSGKFRNLIRASSLRNWFYGLQVWGLVIRIWYWFPWNFDYVKKWTATFGVSILESESGHAIKNQDF